MTAALHPAIASDARCRDRELVLRLYDAGLRALGVQPKIRRDWMEAAGREFGGPHEPGGLASVRAILAVLDGLPLEQVKRGFPEARP